MKRSTGQQIAIWTIGLVVTGVMVFLGLWQMNRFQQQGQDKLIARLAEPAVELSAVAPAGEVPGDSYGRSVNAHGTYLPEQQLLIPERDSRSSRVVTALQLDDGSVLPVVRGITTEQAPPPAPGGRVAATGVFLPTEPSPESTEPLPQGQIGSLRLPQIAQTWPQEITGGFLALEEQQSTAQQLQHWQFDLPSNAGQARSNGYALQWWAFAAAAVAATIKLSRDAHRGTGFMAPSGQVGTKSAPLSTPVDNSVEKPVGRAVDGPPEPVGAAEPPAPAAQTRTNSPDANRASTGGTPSGAVHNDTELPPAPVDNSPQSVGNPQQTRSDKQE